MITPVEEILGYLFTNKHFLQEALTHPSKGGKQFQRLEFLGDRVLNLSLTLLLLKQFPTDTEGLLAKKIAQLASAKQLHKIALKWKLEQQIYCSQSQIQAVLSDACEAVLGAIFLDNNQNLQTLVGIINKFWHADIIANNHQDDKTLLQELAYKKYKSVPSYKTLLHSGGDHNPVFKSYISLLDKKTEGTGSSHKEAEKDAAKKMLERIK